ncbi:zinc finger protein 25-like [Anoplophora glabripennis]|uniref:zinc finger protein 25-like n=1 Tax=Anoplophora glabripennis TaxID=217634 RepID=UPI000875599E|nr:zinc finger protein 25-like [Anoplophora glabripennis]
MSLGGVYQCDVCLRNNSVRLVPLVNHEKVLALKLIKNRRKLVLLLREPTFACLRCFGKLYMFKLCIRNVLITRKINGNMHSQSSSKDKDSSDDQPEEGDATEPCLNDYTCQCTTCQGKYGSLPLLLQVIEQKSREEKTEQTRTRSEEPQPSTSSQESDPKSRRVLVCQFCDKSFTHRGDYNKHLRKHTKEQPFECPVCKRKFAHTSNLQRHYRLHSGHRPFVCANCDKTFSRKDKLECHMRSKFCKKSQCS